MFIGGLRRMFSIPRLQHDMEDVTTIYLFIFKLFTKYAV